VNSYSRLPPDIARLARRLVGPIVIFGAGGFIGANLVRSLLLYRNDVIGVLRSPDKNWRLQGVGDSKRNIIECDLTNLGQVRRVVRRLRPMTVFNLTAYGGYAKQSAYRRIYRTNTLAVVDLFEQLKQNPFSAFVQAGSSSEYGLNAASPSEADILKPNSHYAVSKVAVSYAMRYYGKVEKLPVVHLRLYSVYGPWEEQDRLIPTLLRHVRRGKLPRLVDPDISRDFVYVSDAVAAFILVAAKMKRSLYGEVFNVASGRKTTIRDLASMAKKLFEVVEEPVFSTMENRDWDVTQWYGNPRKIFRELHWKTRVSLEEGLQRTFSWQTAVHSDKVLGRRKHE